MRKLTVLLVFGMVFLICGAVWAQMEDPEMHGDIKNAPVYIDPSWGGLPSHEGMGHMRGGHMMGGCGMGEHMMMGSGGCGCGCGMGEHMMMGSGGCGCGMGEHMMGAGRCGCGTGEHMMGGRHGHMMQGRMMKEYLDRPEIKKFLDDTKDDRYGLLTMKFKYFEAARNPETKPEELKKMRTEIRNKQLDIYKKFPVDFSGGDED
jgi:hypothetical protein